MIKVKLFGIAKEIVGTNLLSIEENIPTVAALLKHLKANYPKFNKLNSLLVAINSEYATAEDTIKEQDEIAIIPPVSGG